MLGRALGRPGRYGQFGRLLVAYRRHVLVLLLAGFCQALVEALGAGLMLLVLGGAGSRAFLPWVGAWLPAALTQSSLAGRFQVAAGLLIAFILARGVLMYIQHTTVFRLRLDAEESLQRQIHRQLHAVRLDYLLRRPMGEALALWEAALQVGRTLQSIGAAAFNLPIVGVYAAACVLLSWPLTLLAGLLLAVSSFATRPLVQQRMRRAVARALDALKELRGLAQENVEGMKTIRLFSREAWSLDRFETHLRLYTEEMWRAHRLAGLMFPVAALINAVSLGVLLLVALRLLSGSDEARLVQVFVFLVVALRLVKPLSDMSLLQSEMTQTGPMLQAITDFLRTDDKPYLVNGHLPCGGLTREVRLEGVSFQYDAEGPSVLSDVSLRIPQGATIALVGPSGAGKTTVINLIARLFDCTAGRILVDGVDVRDLEVGSWRRKLAVVSQDTFLFRMSALENIRLADATASEAAIKAAAVQARADEFLGALPEAYGTNIYDRGARLSGGQQQRVALARALLAEVDLLILDEATSDLDAQTEQEVKRVLVEQRGQRAILIVTHRLSLIRHVDRIYVLERGRVAEAGTHAELMQVNGLYRALVEAEDDIIPETPQK